MFAFRCSVVGKKQLVCVDSRSSTLQTLSLQDGKAFKATLLQVMNQFCDISCHVAHAREVNTVKTKFDVSG